MGSNQSTQDFYSSDESSSDEEECNSEPIVDSSHYSNFAQAAMAAYRELGPGCIFVFKGRRFTTTRGDGQSNYQQYPSRSEQRQQPAFDSPLATSSTPTQPTAPATNVAPQLPPSASPTAFPPFVPPPAPPAAPAGQGREDPNNFTYQKTGGGCDWKGACKLRKYEVWHEGQCVAEFSDKVYHHIALEKAKNWVNGQIAQAKNARLAEDHRKFLFWLEEVARLQVEYERQFRPTECIPPPRPLPPVLDGRADPSNYQLVVKSGGGSDFFGGRNPRTYEVWYNGQHLTTTSHWKDHRIAEEEAQKFVAAQVAEFKAAHEARVRKVNDDYEAEVREKRAEFDRSRLRKLIS